MQEILKALSHSIAISVSIFVPIIIGAAILLGLMRVFHGALHNSVSLLRHEVNVSANIPTNPWAINLLFGLIMAALVGTFIVDSSVFHALNLFLGKPPDDKDSAIVSFIFLLAFFFIACLGVSRLLDHNGPGSET